MRRRLPNLNALRAFEAAARHLSFTKAAAELNVTQGAVSHQVKALEADLGLSLLHRERQRLALTDAGRDLLEVTREAFDGLAAGTENLLDRQNAGVLTVSMSPNFAAKWLVPRLGRFVAAHPDIDLRVAASMQHVDFAREDVDLAIRHGEGLWPGLHVTRLCSEELFPVCSPKLANGSAPIRQPRDLRLHTLLHNDGQQTWRQWLEAAGADEVDPSRGVTFNQASMAIDAAIDGQGVALSRSALVALDLLAGRLVRPFDIRFAAPFAYYVVCPKVAAKKPKIAVFRAWLIAEAEDDSRRLHLQETPQDDRPA
jgi:LysR family glycine cleavage system transcriptional activator